MLILKNISKQYEGSNTAVLNNINLSFDDHGLVSILGASGSGKTTLLNIIGALDKPDTGSVLVDGVDITKLKEKDLNKYHNQVIGFVYQNYNLINYLNVVDNIELINKNTYIESLLEYLNIKNKKFEKIKNLSGGEKQRVAIARSLSNNPRILLCDEPTGALDVKNGENIMEILKSISSETLVIMVTHNQELAEKYSDRIITLQDGNILNDTNSNVLKSQKSTKFPNTKIKIFRILNIILNNLKSKYKRNILTILAFSVGLISLSLVLGISSGFEKSLEVEEKESLSKYPIFISENSTNLDNELKSIFSSPEELDNNYIYKKDTNHKNIIDEYYLDDLSEVEPYLNYHINTYNFNNVVVNISNKKIDELNIIKGKKEISENEALIITNNNTLDESVFLSLNLKEDKYTYDELLSKYFKINKKKYEIAGIASLDDESYLNNLSGILIYDSHPSKTPLNISLYPKDYENKLELLNFLNKYKDIEYTDYSTTIKSFGTTLMNGVSIILICFSSISLLVSTITIGIISYISVIERVKEIGLFKSLGLSNSHIKEIFLLENIILGVISSIFSFTICKIISVPFNEALSNLTGMNNIFLIDSKLLMTILSVSITLSTIGSYFPIKKTRKLRIVDCLKYE